LNVKGEFNSALNYFRQAEKLYLLGKKTGLQQDWSVSGLKEFYPDYVSFRDSF